jgi:hypothetical protein
MISRSLREDVERRRECIITKNERNIRTVVYLVVKPIREEMVESLMVSLVLLKTRW